MNNGPRQDMSRPEQTVKKETVERLLRSQDTKRMMELLGAQGDVKGAAKAAASGDASRLMGMMQQLMRDPEGAKLVERIKNQAEGSGR